MDENTLSLAGNLRQRESLVFSLRSNKLLNFYQKLSDCNN